MRNRDRYPPDWETVSLRIRTERARSRCEWCGAENGKPHPVTGSRVILTVAHLGTPHPDGRPGDKHDKHDCRPENLAALCQACHLSYDRQENIVAARATRIRKRHAGMGLLPFEDDLAGHVALPTKGRRVRASAASTARVQKGR